MSQRKFDFLHDPKNSEPLNRDDFLVLDLTPEEESQILGAVIDPKMPIAVRAAVRTNYNGEEALFDFVEGFPTSAERHIADDSTVLVQVTYIVEDYTHVPEHLANIKGINNRLRNDRAEALLIQRGNELEAAKRALVEAEQRVAAARAAL